MWLCVRFPAEVAGDALRLEIRSCCQWVLPSDRSVVGCRFVLLCVLVVCSAGDGTPGLSVPGSCSAAEPTAMVSERFSVFLLFTFVNGNFSVKHFCSPVFYFLVMFSTKFTMACYSFGHNPIFYYLYY